MAPFPNAVVQSSIEGVASQSLRLCLFDVNGDIGGGHQAAA